MTKKQNKELSAHVKEKKMNLNHYSQSTHIISLISPRYFTSSLFKCSNHNKFIIKIIINANFFYYLLVINDKIKFIFLIFHYKVIPFLLLR